MRSSEISASLRTVDGVGLGLSSSLHRLPISGVEMGEEPGGDDGLADIGVGACDEKAFAKRLIQGRRARLNGRTLISTRPRSTHASTSLAAHRAHLPLVGVCIATAEAKTLRMAYDADPTSLDPHEQLASATLQLSHLTFDPLLRFRQDLTLEPRLAKSWEKIDERTTRFHLRGRRALPFRAHALGAGRGVDLQSAEAEPRLQGAVRAVQRGEGGR